MTNFSEPSNPVFCIDIPEIGEIKAKFFYNFYVYDEGTNERSGIPPIYTRISPELIGENQTENSDFTLRVPRYIRVTWTPYQVAQNVDSTDLIKRNSSKIVTEDSLTSSKFLNYTYSSVQKIEEAFRDINKDNNVDLDTSQATVIDQYVSSLLQDYVETGQETDVAVIRKKIAQAVENIEKIADRPSTTKGATFYDNEGNEIRETSGFDKLVAGPEAFLNTQINSLVIPDLFSNAVLPTSTVNELQTFYKNNANRQQFNVNDALIEPIAVGGVITDPYSYNSSVSVIGYIIERYEKTANGFIKNKVFIIGNIEKNNFTDVLIKYGVTYYYSIRSVAKIDTAAFDDDSGFVKGISYLVSSKPTVCYVDCIDNVAPPPPVDIDCVWDYKKSKLNIIWGMPVNFQRDIKQFQVFRRSSIHEPFELIKQKSFDFSTRKFQTGEQIDGNLVEPTGEQLSFIDYGSMPSMSHIDDDFTVDIELLSSSKYIYTVCSVDAHGLISNYGMQLEVSFDFFKNHLIKKMISVSGSPRQYPNMYSDVDLFKDVISTSGEASMKMKVYFMPEYYKIKYNNGSVERLVFTSEENAKYKIQFINTQNQKSESLEISIEDPHGLTK